ncbi:MAG: propionyl-CoA synthetase [Solirubrobacterales bacterium]|nr:propionyl-CoA synthetase [Solirubrobacterales bacterium]
MSYEQVFSASIGDPEAYWAGNAEAIDWIRKPARVLDNSRPPFARWFPDGVLNTAANALDRHVDAGRGEQAALIYDSPVTDTKKTISYRELRDQVARFAGALARLGVVKGDRVVIYMPMVPEAAVAMLACARLGAIHSTVFGGFASPELAVRIDAAAPKVVVSASCGVEGSRVLPYKPLLDRAIELSSYKPEHCVILQRPQAEAELQAGRDHTWADSVAYAEPVPPAEVAATDPLYILYTSGTTSTPKGVVRDNGGHAVALCWSMEAIFDTQPGDVFWAASDVGWVVGHSYIVYGPLLAGATTVLYEGKPVGTPDPGAFWRVISEHKVNNLFTAPTALRAIKKEDPEGTHTRRYDLSSLRHLFLAGERLDPDTYQWASDLLGVPVIDNWWQTETGWPVAANCLGLGAQPLKAGSPTKPVPGYDVRILKEDGTDAAPGEEGAIAIREPLPPGTLQTLWQDDERCKRSYFTTYPGYYLTGDGGRFDQDGYLFVLGRMDDVINVAGHRLSTGTLEESLARDPEVAEAAVIGVADELKGQVPVGFVVLKAGEHGDPEALRKALVARVRADVGAVAALKQIEIVPRLPKTRSGKILRATMRAIAEGREYKVPSTIDDPAVLDEIAALFSASAA